MEIKINGKPADITLEHEKTIGEVIVNLDQWLNNSGHRLSGLAVNDQTIDLSLIETVFSRETNTVKILDIYTSSVAELSVQSLLHLLGDIDDHNSLSFDEKQIFFNNWKSMPQAQFTSEQMPDIFLLYSNAFSQGGVDSDILRSITEERLREIQEPVFEFEKMRSLIDDVCARLVDISLDIQTGKDAKAAQTIQLFSGIAVKILRIFGQLDFQGFFEDSVPPSIDNFNGNVKELLDAYERQDTVLVGDLAEYEIAPGLQELYNAILDNIHKRASNRV
jgi:hypothetical protein